MTEVVVALTVLNEVKSALATENRVHVGSLTTWGTGATKRVQKSLAARVPRPLRAAPQASEDGAATARPAKAAAVKRIATEVRMRNAR